jgi:hypothetical protein
VPYYEVTFTQMHHELENCSNELMKQPTTTCKENMETSDRPLAYVQTIQVPININDQSVISSIYSLVFFCQLGIEAYRWF